MSSFTSLHGRIRAIVGDAVARGALAPGAVLMEAAIADALGVSRTPVKTALEAMRGEGLLAKLEGRGYIVLPADEAGAGDSFRIGRDAFAALAQEAAFESRGPAAWSGIYDAVETEVAGSSLYGRLRVVEVEVAKTFSVSRSVARDVLSRIEKVGLIVKDDRRVWRVVPLTPERTSHIYELRRALEPVALRRAAERGRHIRVAPGMRDRLNAARARLPYVAPHEISSFERELHIDLLGACGNPEIVKALKLGQLQIAANHQLLGRVGHIFSMILSEHLAVVDRLAADDIVGATDALAAHLGDHKAVMVERAAALAATAPPAFPSYLQRDDAPPTAGRARRREN